MIQCTKIQHTKAQRAALYCNGMKLYFANFVVEKEDVTAESAKKVQGGTKKGVQFLSVYGIFSGGT